jgi:AcrR family transcriptional regulator
MTLSLLFAGVDGTDTRPTVGLQAELAEKGSPHPPRMSEDKKSKRPRVIKAPAIRRAELIGCAQRLFLLKGYEKTTINDVIAATGLSKGAFYHHFRSKEDLLEAIAARFAQQGLAFVISVQENTSLNTLQRFNALLAVSRAWKVENLQQLRAVFTTMLRPENAVLYFRIINAMHLATSPMLTAMIEQGVREGVFDVSDARTAADALVWLGSARHAIMARAMATAESGDLDMAAQQIFHRFRAEGLIIDRILGVEPGSVDLVGSLDYIKALLTAWNSKQKTKKHRPASLGTDSPALS